MDKLGIHSIDHIVMQAVDVLDTIKFYTEILGMTHSEFQPPTGGPVRQSLHFGAQKINLHDAGSPFRPHAKNPRLDATRVVVPTGCLYTPLKQTNGLH